MKTYFKVGDTAYFVSWDNQIIEGKIEKILDSDYDYPVIFKTETVSYTFTHEGKHRKENNFISLFQQKPKINNAKKHKNETKIYFNADDSKHTIFSKHSGQ